MAPLRTLLYLVAFGWLGLSAIVWLVYFPALNTVSLGSIVLLLLPLVRVFPAFWFQSSGGMLSLAVAAVVLVFVARRVLAFRTQRSVAPPDSFSGFAYGLAWLGLVLMSAHVVALVLAPTLGMRFPSLYALAFRFGPAWYTPWLVLAFFMSELPTLRAAQAVTPAPRRRPICGPLALALPFLSLAPIFVADRIGVSGWGGFALGVLWIYSGVALGTIFAVAAVLRRERLVPIQVVAAFVNLSSAAHLISIQ